MRTAIQVLQEALRTQTSAPVVMRVPNPRPPLFVRVESVGGKRMGPNHERTPMIVQVQGVKERDVVELALKLYDYCCLDVAAQPEIMGWDDDSAPYRFPDPDVASEERWQFSGTIFRSLT